ncbi:MAG: hypothetical protein FWF56_04265 [Firmicutes bacterium]|nr:hypothetical protein [Bacillota bacterium]MCL1953409.1 hypothetical protein [Bacillota bacterium]
MKKILTKNTVAILILTLLCGCVLLACFKIKQGGEINLGLTTKDAKVAQGSFTTVEAKFKDGDSNMSLPDNAELTWTAEPAGKVELKDFGANKLIKEVHAIWDGNILEEGKDQTVKVKLQAKWEEHSMDKTVDIVVVPAISTNMYVQMFSALQDMKKGDFDADNVADQQNLEKCTMLASALQGAVSIPKTEPNSQYHTPFQVLSNIVDGLAKDVFSDKFYNWAKEFDSEKINNEELEEFILGISTPVSELIEKIFKELDSDNTITQEKKDEFLQELDSIWNSEKEKELGEIIAKAYKDVITFFEQDGLKAFEKNFGNMVVEMATQLSTSMIQSIVDIVKGMLEELL